MRATLTDARLQKYAGRFVWLDLNFDNTGNQAFLTSHGVTYTPSVFVLDPGDEHAIATQLGGMDLSELLALLNRADASFHANSASPANQSMAEGDAMQGRGESAAAAAKYREALNLGGAGWPQREHAVGSLTWALMLSGQVQSCAETAAREAPRMTRGEMFGRVVLAGMTCVNQGPSASWVEPARKVLEPLASEAIALPSTIRDHRFQLYQQSMFAAKNRGELATVKRFGELWLKELDSTTPANDDERSALDVARVDAASLMDDPVRVLPALAASERAMPANFNASLRLAQMQIEAKAYDEAIAACDRGLAKPNGPMGRTWLLQTKADALLRMDKPALAHHVLEEALQAAQQIAVKDARDRNVAKVQKIMKEIENGSKP